MNRTFKNLGLFVLASATFLNCQKDKEVEDSSTREHRFCGCWFRIRNPNS
ncbi:hypothetical protein [Siphonobacter sp. BAB-5385]|nr:hypothetical protein [Siphonobacter sp. BAB-5385]